MQNLKIENLPKIKTPLTMSRFFLGKHLRKFQIFIALAFVEIFILSFRTYSFKFVIDALATKNLENLKWALIFCASVFIVGNLMRSINKIRYTVFNTKIVENYRKFCFEYLLKQPQAFFANNLSGKLTSDQGELIALTFWYLRRHFQNARIMQLLVYIAIAFSVNIYLGLLFIGLGAILYLIYSNQSKKIHELSKTNDSHRSKVTGIIFDYIANISLVRLFNSQKQEAKLQADYLTNHTQSSIDLYIQKHKLNSYSNLVLVGLEICVTLFLITLLQKSLVSIGDVSVALLYLYTFKGRFQSLISVQSELKSEEGAKQSTIDRLFVPLTQQDPKVPLPKPNSPELHIKNLNLCLAQNHVLKNLNLHIKPGEKIGLVGESGAGKSTLVQTLMRLHMPSQHQVFIGNKDITQLKLSDILDMYSIVDQDTLLYNDTFEYNLTLGKKFTKSEVNKAIKQAYLTDFVKSLPKGVQTKVGERGVRLSGGQKQRLGIARAILFNAPILILDEATASLDSESEQIIQKSIENLIKDKTVIAIAHRLSTLNIMDRIIVMDKGQIIEDGSHKQLIKDKGTYYQLWQHQSDNFY
jgi:ABC-type multidrug transport system fused ATPase/permease subunit